MPKAVELARKGAMTCDDENAECYPKMLLPGPTRLKAVGPPRMLLSRGRVTQVALWSRTNHQEL